MGRAERRKEERRNRIEDRKEKVLLSKRELDSLKAKLSEEVSKHSTETLMTCFALAEHRLYGFGYRRILRTLQYVDDLMGDILTDEVTVDDLKEQLERETNVAIKCD